MLLDKIHILPTNKTPEIILNPEGKVVIKGRGLTINKTEVSNKIMNWIDTYIDNPAETTNVKIEFEYLNSFNTTILVSILNKLLQICQQSKKVLIKWYYDEDDEDILERGEYISSIINIPFEFIMKNKINGH
jgi:hypothetical protein